MKKFRIVILLIAAVLLSCGDKEVTDYYELDYKPEYSYLSGGMDVNLSIQERGFNEIGYSEKEAITLMEHEFAEELAELTSMTNENTDPEHFTQEQVDIVVENIHKDATLWKRWLICVTHPSKEDPKEAVEKIKKSYKEVVKKGEYVDGNYKIKIIPINPK